MGIWISALPVIYYKTPNISRNYTRRLQKKIIIKFKGRRYWSDFKTKNKSEDFAPDVCEWTCNNEKNHKLPSCNKVQMSLKSMYNAWDEYVNNGYL